MASIKILQARMTLTFDLLTPARGLARKRAPFVGNQQRPHVASAHSGFASEGIRGETLRKIGFILTTALCVLPASRALAQNATDNADNAPYADGGYLGDTGGTFAGPWEEQENTGGGTFVTTTRQTDGLRSFSIYSGTGHYAVGRGGTVSQSAKYTVNSRHDLNSETGFSGFNIKASGFGFATNEVIRFGLPGTATPGNPFNTVLVQGADGPKLLTMAGGDGEIRGDILSWSLWINTPFPGGTYTLHVSSNDGGFASATGLTTPTTGLLGLGFANFNTGANQNFHFDNPTLAPIPEPAMLSVLALAPLFLLRRRGRSN
jgi:hypothetical protein